MPPQANAEVVYSRQAVLTVYQQPDEALHPLIGMDELSQPWVAEVAQPLPIQPGQPAC